MKSKLFSLTRYDADDGYVFDWLTPRYEEDEKGNRIQQHLYAKTLLVGYTDSIDNYVEVVKPQEEKL